MAALGVFPPGARVRLPDGRVGVVAGEGSPEDPSRPRVYLDGTLQVPSGPVRLVLG